MSSIIFTPSSSLKGDEICTNCKADKEATESIKTLCGHFFHRGCLTKWIEQAHASCPRCNTSLKGPLPKEHTVLSVEFRKDFSKILIITIPSGEKMMIFVSPPESDPFEGVGRLG